jgi:hypothetical protein
MKGSAMLNQLLARVLLAVLCAAGTEPATNPAEIAPSDEQISNVIQRATVKKDMGAIDTLFHDLNTALRPVDQQGYVNACMKISEALTTFDFKDSKRWALASEVACSGLESVDDQTPIGYQIQLAVRLRPQVVAAAAGNQDELRNHYMKLWTAVVRRLNSLASERVGDEQVMDAVPPGFEKDVDVAGEDPSAIGDPVRRQQYAAALARLEDQSIHRNEVIRAKESVKDATDAYVGFVNAVYLKVPSAVRRAELGGYIDQSQITGTDRGRIKFSPI